MLARHASLDSIATTASDDDDATSVVAQGYLFKRGGGTTKFGRQNWKERFFLLLADGSLSYYRTRGEYQDGSPPVKPPASMRHAVVRSADDTEPQALPPSAPVAFLSPMHPSAGAGAAAGGPTGGGGAAGARAGAGAGAGAGPAAPVASPSTSIGRTTSTGAMLFEFEVETSASSSARGAARVWKFRARSDADRVKWLHAFNQVSATPSRRPSLATDGAVSAMGAMGVGGLGGITFGASLLTAAMRRAERASSQPDAARVGAGSPGSRRASAAAELSLSPRSGSTTTPPGATLPPGSSTAAGRSKPALSRRKSMLTMPSFRMRKVITRAGMLRVYFGRVKGWCRRWVTLEDGALTCFHSDRERDKVWSVPVKHTASRPVPHHQDQFEVAILQGGGALGGAAPPSAPSRTFLGNVMSKLFGRKARRAAKLTKSSASRDENVIVRNGAIVTLVVFRAESNAARNAWLSDLQTVALARAPQRSGGAQSVLPSGDAAELLVRQQQVANKAHSQRAKKDESLSRHLVLFADEMKDVRRVTVQAVLDAAAKCVAPGVAPTDADAAEGEARGLVTVAAGLLTSQFWEVVTRAAACLHGLAALLPTVARAPLSVPPRVLSPAALASSPRTPPVDLPDMDTAARQRFGDVLVRLVKDGGVVQGVLGALRDVFGASRRFGTPRLDSVEQRKLDAHTNIASVHTMAVQALCSMAACDDLVPLLLRARPVPALAVVLPFEPSLMYPAADLVAAVTTAAAGRAGSPDSDATLVALAPALVQLVDAVVSALWRVTNRRHWAREAAATRPMARSHSYGKGSSAGGGAGGAVSTSSVVSVAGGPQPAPIPRSRRGSASEPSLPVASPPTRRGSDTGFTAATSTSLDTTSVPSNRRHGIAGATTGLGLELPVGVSLVAPPQPAPTVLPSFGSDTLWQGAGWSLLAQRYQDAVLTPTPAATVSAPVPLSRSPGSTAAAVAAVAAVAASLAPAPAPSRQSPAASPLPSPTVSPSASPPLHPVAPAAVSTLPPTLPQHASAPDVRRRTVSATTRATALSGPSSPSRSRLHTLLRSRSSTILRYHTARWQPQRAPLPSVDEAGPEPVTPDSQSSAPPAAAAHAPHLSLDSAPASQSLLSYGSSRSLRSAASSTSSAGGTGSIGAGDDAATDAAAEAALATLLQACVSVVNASEAAASDFATHGGVAVLLQVLRLQHSRPPSPGYAIAGDTHQLLLALAAYLPTSSAVRSAFHDAHTSLTDHLSALLLAHYVDTALADPDADARGPHGRFPDSCTADATSGPGMVVRLLWHLQTAFHTPDLTLEAAVADLADQLASRCRGELSASSATEWAGIAAALHRSLAGYRDVDDAVVESSASPTWPDDDASPAVSPVATPNHSAPSSPVRVARCVPRPAEAVTTTADAGSGEPKATPPHLTTSPAATATAAAAAPAPTVAAGSTVVTPPGGAKPATGDGGSGGGGGVEESKATVKPKPSLVPTRSTLAAMLDRSDVSDNAVHLSGTLSKRLARGTSASRYFVLNAGTLSYFATPSSATVRGQRAVAGAVVTLRERKPMFSSSLRYCMDLSHPSWESPWRLHTTSSEDRDRWVRGLVKCGAKLS